MDRAITFEAAGPPRKRVGAGLAAGILALFLLGVAGAIYPLYGLGLFAAIIIAGICYFVASRLKSARLELWQVLTLTGVSGYLILNYGFENLTIHVGSFPIIISYGLMYTCVGLALLSSKGLLRLAMKEPPFLLFFGLFAMVLLHLAFDLPEYGIWAVRDSTMILDGVFMLLGYAWARKRNSIVPLLGWLMLLLAVNLPYSYTLPWTDAITAVSPTSGVFLQIPVIGNYHTSALVLVAGAMFCICLGSYLTNKQWMLLGLAAAQLLGLAIQQARQMYVGVVACILILIVLGETAKYGKLVLMLVSAITVLALATTVGGLQLSGRIGPITMDFFKEHIRSISGAEGTPGSTVQSRLEWYDEAFAHIEAHPFVGEGFGMPLLSYVDDTSGAVVRMPHNSSLNLLARLGAIGLVAWIAFHVSLLKIFFNIYRQRRGCDKRLYDFMQWLFLWYVLFMIVSWVEGPFEYPSGAVPFYFFTGLTVGLARWQVPDQKRAPRSSIHVRTSEIPV
ncbi:MAG: O-antigen ligase family protein [Acidobacteriaceae bacterium]|nr:O-antigen ligase family protein [Acidobacteriaceae bacterium]